MTLIITRNNPFNRLTHKSAHYCCVPISRRLCKLNAVICQDRVDLVGHGLKQMLRALPGRHAVGFLHQLGDCELTGPVDGHIEKQLSLFGPDLGNADLEEADRVACELLLFGFVAIHIRQARNAMPLKAAMKRRAGQMWD